MAYQPCGDLLIETPGDSKAENHRRWLDLDSVIAITEWTADGTTFRRETFASHPANLIVTRISADKPGKTTATIKLGCQHKDHSITVEKPATLVLKGKVQDDGVAFEARAVVTHKGGTLDGNRGLHPDHRRGFHRDPPHRRHQRRVMEKPRRRSRQTRRGNPRPLREAKTTRPCSTPTSPITARSSAAFPSTSAARLPPIATTDARIAAFKDGKDPQLAALLFQYGRYLLIGSSRARRPARQPARHLERFTNVRPGIPNTPATSTPR